MFTHFVYHHVKQHQACRKYFGTNNIKTSYLEEVLYQNSNYIIQSTYFQYMANISAIEYVPATTGDLIIDVSIIIIIEV